MFNDDNHDAGPWFSEGHDGQPPEGAQVMTMQVLRDQALAMFGQAINKASGIRADFDTAPLEERQAFLSLAETESIVRSFSAANDGEYFAVGGGSKEEAMQKIQQLMEALVTRVMSNVIAEGVRRDLVDVAFDGDQNEFAFKVNANGMQLLEQNKDMFSDDNS